MELLLYLKATIMFHEIKKKNHFINHADFRQRQSETVQAPKYLKLCTMRMHAKCIDLQMKRK